MASLRKITKRVFIIANSVVAFLFLLACCNSFLHPDKWWLISLLGLFFPLLLLLLFLFFVFWIFFNARMCLLSLLTMLIGWTNIHAVLALHFASHSYAEKPANSLRVLTWNVRSWDEFITKKAGASGNREGMLRFVQSQNADVLCFQEFLEPVHFKELQSNIPYISQQLHYPYYFFSHDYHRYSGRIETGVIIFSRYPIVDSVRIRYSNDSVKASESLLMADINVNGKMIRIGTTHLQSVLFRSKDFRNVEIIRNVEEDSMLEASKSIVKKLKRAFALRGYQADVVRSRLDNSPYPVIICGDFNDVPNSYTYFRILGDRQDAFIKKGFGIGRTYIHLSPTLRIDYIMADKKFTVLQCRQFKLPYSDHRPVLADLELPK